MFPVNRLTLYVIGVLGVSIAIFFSVQHLKSKYKKVGYDQAVQEYTQKAFEAEKLSRAKELEMSRRMQDARDESVKRDAKIALLSRQLNGTTKQLRNVIDTNSSQLSRASKKAVDSYAKTLGDVFGECTEKYSALAGEADESSSKLMLLEDSWPR